MDKKDEGIEGETEESEAHGEEVFEEEKDTAWADRCRK